MSELAEIVSAHQMMPLTAGQRPGDRENVLVDGYGCTCGDKTMPRRDARGRPVRGIWHNEHLTAALTVWLAAHDADLRERIARARRWIETCVDPVAVTPGVKRAMLGYLDGTTDVPDDLADLPRPTSLSELVVSISSMIDSTYPDDIDPEAHRWRRCAKVSEEAGEVIEALLGVVGENPRKGMTHSLADLETELLDTAAAALGAVAHLHGNDCDPVAQLLEHVLRRHMRLEQAITP